MGEISKTICIIQRFSLPLQRYYLLITNSTIHNLIIFRYEKDFYILIGIAIE